MLFKRFFPGTCLGTDYDSDRTLTSTFLTFSSTVAGHPTDLLVAIGRAAGTQRVVRLAEFEIFETALAGGL